MVPATCVPWPLQSFALPPAVTASYPVTARPPNSRCVSRIPVSITYAVTPAPVAVYVNVVESGSACWSIRSRPAGRARLGRRRPDHAVGLDVGDGRCRAERGQLGRRERDRVALERVVEDVPHLAA